jgi:pimeloyl-ACP methyl ester carboxylesterase
MSAPKSDAMPWVAKAGGAVALAAALTYPGAVSACLVVEHDDAEEPTRVRVEVGPPPAGQTAAGAVWALRYLVRKLFPAAVRATVYAYRTADPGELPGVVTVLAGPGG